MRENQIARHWKVLLTLDARRYGASVKELSSLMDCTIRTIYRDLDALMEAGFPITTDRTDNETRYLFSEEYRLRLKMQFSPMELLALSLVTEAQQFMEGTVFHEALESVKGKVEATLGDKYRGYAETIQEMFQATFRPVRNYANYKNVIDAITKSLLEKKCLEISYWSAGSRMETQRKIEPHRLWFVNGIFYVISYCHLRQKFRTFMIDRIKSYEFTEETYKLRKEFNFEEYIKHGFKVKSGGKVQDVVVRVHPILKPQMTEQMWHPSQKLEELDDGWMRVSFRLSSLDEVKTWVQGYAPYIIVEKPKALIDEVMESFKACLDCY